MNDGNAAGLHFPSRPSLGRNVLWIASIALIYFAAARISLSLKFQPEGLAAIWPPTGIFLSAVLLTRRGLRPWLVGTLFLTDLVAEVLAGTPFLVSAIYSLSLAGDAVLSAWLLIRFVGEPLTFRRVRDLVGWLALSVLFSNALTSLVAAGASELLPGIHSFWNSWRWSAAPDGVGNLLVTPFILSWAAWARTRFGAWNWQRVLEWAALFISLALLSLALFWNLPEHRLFALFLPYAILPFLLWASLRFGVRGVATASVVVAAIAVPFVAAGRIPSFSLVPGVLDDVIVMQLFLAVAAIPALFLAVTITERQQAHEALQESEERFRTLFDQAIDGMLLADVETKLFTFANRQIQRMLGYSEDELLRLTVEDLHPAADLPVVLDQFGKLARRAITLAREIPVKCKDGTVFYADISSTAVRLQERDCLLGIFRDVTERRQAEEKLRRTNRALQMVSDCNQELVRATNETDLLQGICRIAVEQGGYRMAWVGFAEQDEARSVRPVARSGFDDGYLDAARITWADEERGRGPAGTAIRTGQPVATRDIRTDLTFAPWRDAAIKRGYASSIALPLQEEGRCLGALIMYAGQPDAFDPEEVKLLAELAGDLSYGIGALRHRGERAQAEAEAERAARDWQATFDATNDAIWILDRDHRVLRTNKIAERFFHRPCAEMLGERCWAIVHGTAEPHPNCPFVRARQSGRRETMELQQGGRWLEVTVDPILDATGQYTGAVHIVSDITEAKQAEEALRREKDFAESMVKTAQTVVLVLDTEGRIVRFNPYLEEISGHRLEEMQGRDWFTTFLPEPGRDRLRALFLRAIADIQTRGNVNPIVTKDGRECMIEWYDKTLKNADGEVIGLLSIGQDITERKRAEDELRKSEERFREQATLLDAANDAIYVRALDHTVTYWNDGAERLYGWPRAEALGRKITDLGDLDHAAFAAAHAALLEQGYWSGELKKTSKEGKERLVFCRWTLLRDEQGRPKEILAINTDITEKKQLEAQFLRAQRMEGIGALAGGIAHDLNNILTPILMSVPLLRETVGDLRKPRDARHRANLRPARSGHHQATAHLCPRPARRARAPADASPPARNERDHPRDFPAEHPP